MLSFSEKREYVAFVRSSIPKDIRMQLVDLMQEQILNKTELKIFLWEFASLVEDAKEPGVPSRKVIHREIRELAGEARKLLKKLDSLHAATWNRLEDEYISDIERLNTYHAPLKRLATYALERICSYDEEISKLAEKASGKNADLSIARYKSDTTDYFTDLECQLADSFERHGVEIKISEKGVFAESLRIYRKICGYPKFKPYAVSEARIHRIQDRRNKNLHHK